MVLPTTPTRPIPSHKDEAKSESGRFVLSSPTVTSNAAHDLVDRAKSIQKELQKQNRYFYHPQHREDAFLVQQEQVKNLLHYALCLQEAEGGFFNEGTAQIYHSIAWYHYEMDDHSTALTFFLQCLRISKELCGEDHCSTQLTMDDLQDLLEDMQLENAAPDEYLSRVFDSWALQKDAAMLRLGTNDNYGGGNREESLWEEECLQTALTLLPSELGLERAAVFALLAEHAERQSQTELALSYYCQSLMILPQWLCHQHPRVVTMTNTVHQVAAALTPMVPQARRMVETTRSSSSVSSSSLTSSFWSSSFHLPPPSNE